MTNTFFIFKNKNLFRNLSGLIFQLAVKADLHGNCMIFAYDYRARLAGVMTFDHP